MTLSRPSAHLDGARIVALHQGEDPTDEEAEHLLDCFACTARAEGTEEPVPLLHTLRDAPPLLDLEVGEARLLAAAAASPKPVRFLSTYRLAATGGLLAVAAGALLVVTLGRDAGPGATGPLPASSGSHATLVLAGKAAAVPMQTGEDEVIALRGEATVSVRKLPAGHRFRLRAGSDEIEVRGTRFVARGSEEALEEVVVEEGIVDVRTTCCPAVTLRAGDRWTRSAALLSVASGAPPAIAPNAVDGGAPASSGLTPPPDMPTPSPPGASPPSSMPTPSPAAPAPADLLAQGTAAYDAGRFSVAATLLSKAAAADPKASWARDAATLAGAARVLSTPASSIPSLPVSVSSFDSAAARARQRGEAGLAAAAGLGAARRSVGKAAASRYCALRGNAALGRAERDEVERRCTAAP